jgi:hypothetical protein
MECDVALSFAHIWEWQLVVWQQSVIKMQNNGLIYK